MIPALDLSLLELHQVWSFSSGFVRCPKDSVAALTGAVFRGEWNEAQSFEVIKIRKAGRSVAVRQRFSTGQTRCREGWDCGAKEST